MVVIATGPPITEEEADRIVKVYERVHSIRKTAKVVGRSAMGVHAVLRRRGVGVRGRGGTNNHLVQREVARMVQMYLYGGPGGHGMFLDEVAAETGRSRATIWHHMEQAGVLRSKAAAREIEMRRAGRAPRVLAPRVGRKPDDNLELPLEPFSRWLGKMEARYGSLEALGAVIDRDPGPLRRMLNQRESGGQRKYSVRLDTADLIVSREGSSHVREIWPELYGELEEAA